MKKETLYRIFSDLPTLETDRLILRRMLVSDSECMFDYASRPETSRFLMWSAHKNIEYTREYLRYVGQRYRMGSFYDWAVEEKSSHRMIGTCGFTSVDCPNNKGEVGYVIHPDFAGVGYATEAARAVMTFGFLQLGLVRIEARFMRGNDASRRVMEKLGMQFEGFARGSLLVKGVYRDIGTCAILKDEFVKGNG